MWLTMNLWPTLEDFKPEESEQEGFGGERDGACGGSWSEMSRCLIGREELDRRVNLANWSHLGSTKVCYGGSVYFFCSKTRLCETPYVWCTWHWSSATYQSVLSRRSANTFVWLTEDICGEDTIVRPVSDCSYFERATVLWQVQIPEPVPSSSLQHPAARI